MREIFSQCDNVAPRVETFYCRDWLPTEEHCQKRTTSESSSCRTKVCIVVQIRRRDSESTTPVPPNQISRTRFVASQTSITWSPGNQIRETRCVRCETSITRAVRSGASRTRSVNVWPRVDWYLRSQPSGLCFPYQSGTRITRDSISKHIHPRREHLLRHAKYTENRNSQCKTLPVQNKQEFSLEFSISRKRFLALNKLSQLRKLLLKQTPGRERVN